MKRFLILWGLILSSLLIRAQQDYFLFFQSENNQPYYIMMNEKTFSSSSIGHLIISGLKDTIYSLSIGFPKNRYPEQSFQVRINRKDAGYQLKNVGQEGWVLVNLQTLQQIKPQTVISNKQTISYGDVKRTDVFSTLMAGLVNDSAVLYTSVARVEPAKETKEVAKVEETRKADTVFAIIEQDPIKKDTLGAKTAVVKQPDTQSRDPLKMSDVVKQPETRKGDTVFVATEVPPVNITEKPMVDSVSNPASVRTEPTKNTGRKSVVMGIKETKTAAGTELVFVDRSSPAKPDTIQILIPIETEIVKNNATSKVIDRENTGSADSARKNESRNVGIAKNDNVKRDKTDEQKEEKNGIERFFSRIFRKRSKESQKNRSESEDKTSSIKVVDLEEKADKTPDTSTQRSKAKQEVSRKDTEKDQVDQNTVRSEKKGIKKFFAKIFGKKEEGDAKENEAKKSEPVPNSSVKVTTIDSPAINNKSNEPAVVNSDCRGFASDGDVTRLRNKMLGEKDADGQISEARKVFKQKCFSTKQIKTLSEMFRTDEGKYKLFDAAYPFVSDTNNFKDLAGLLSEEYYINRFKAMVRM